MPGLFYSWENQLLFLSDSKEKFGRKAPSVRCFRNVMATDGGRCNVVSWFYVFR